MRSRIDTLVYLRSLNFAGVVMLTVAMALMAATIAGGVTQDDPGRADADEAAVRVDDVMVSGRRLRDEVQVFVDEVAAPPPGRGLARWRDSLCVSTVNIDNAVAQSLIDHIYRVAMDNGLRVRDPGCKPHAVIFFTDDGAGLASALVSNEPAVFDIRWSTQLHRGPKALRAFQASEAPVRWWHVSVPVLGLTGERAIRMPGDLGVLLIPGEGIVNRGRPISDSLSKVIIIVDLSKIGDVMLPELGDYLAMVSLAQVDPEGDTSRHDSILNLFNRSGERQSMSGWDKAYLASLYGAYPERIYPYDHASSMARGIRRAEAKPHVESNR